MGSISFSSSFSSYHSHICIHSEWVIPLYSLLIMSYTPSEDPTSNVATALSIVNTMSSTSTPIVSSISLECNTCPHNDNGFTPLRDSLAAFPLAPGQYLHEITGNETKLDRFVKLMSTSSVYRLFYTYTTIISRDAHRCTTSYSKYTNLNRYIDVPCNEEYRVVLSSMPDCDYIHANYCDGFQKNKKFIATQSPLETTLERFWAMAWQEKVVMIVAMYVPNYYYPLKSGDTVTYGSFSIVNQGTRSVRGVYDATLLKVTNGLENRTILHFEYFDWPRKSTPRHPSELINLRADVKYNYDLMRGIAEKEGWLTSKDESPIVVTCCSGSGRSTTFIAIDIICDKMDYSYAHRRECVVDIVDTVTRLRTQRATSVQKPEQFVVINFVCLEYAFRKKYIETDDVSALVMTNYYLFPTQETSVSQDNVN